MVTRLAQVKLWKVPMAEKPTKIYVGPCLVDQRNRLMSGHRPQEPSEKARPIHNPGFRLLWLVGATDSWMRANADVVVIEKPQAAKGRFIHPGWEKPTVAGHLDSAGAATAFNVGGVVGWPLTPLIPARAWRQQAMRLGWSPFLTGGSDTISPDL